jgi:hypothetical protein
MYDLSNFHLHDMAECAQALRKLGAGADGLLHVAEKTVRFFYDKFRQEDGTSACALVRFFKTHRYGGLSRELQQVAAGMLGGLPEADNLFCLTLLATAGDEPHWNSPQASKQHRAIPLASEQVVKQSPMIAQLIKQFGVDAAAVVQPEPDLLVDVEQTTFNVFHVPEAEGSPFVPAQAEFVAPYHIKSVLGFGGMLPTGELFAVILFSKVEIPRTTAEMFKTLALSIKVSVLPFVGRPVFQEPPQAPPHIAV